VRSLTLLLTGCLLFAACSDSATESAAPKLLLRERKLAVMGTELLITALHADEKLLDRALDAAVLEIQRVEDLMTDWRASPLTTLNQVAGVGPHEVPEELAQLIDRGLAVAELSGGAFDLTFRTFGMLWDFKAVPPQLPEAAAIEAALAKCGWQKVQVDLEASQITRPEGIEIGLGGIAKGFGVDRAMAVLMEFGIQHAVVNAGGDLKALGRNFDELWSIAIRHPRDRERVIALLPISNTCVVTSGDYERFFEYEGKRYHHILDPRTGYPAQGCMSATVVAPDAAIADALATAVCVLGVEKGFALIESLPRIDALAVDMQGKVFATSGLLQSLPESAQAEPAKAEER
jgi:FAD:protein FMN transferase